MRIFHLFIIISLSFNVSLQAQEALENWKWTNPVKGKVQVVEGRISHEALQSPYDRLPASFEAKTRKAVWNLSRHSAGLKIRFKTNASVIKVRYTLGLERIAMNHMPATGVSGLDLYRKNGAGWYWCRGGRSFKDTVMYTFSGLSSVSAEEEYHLYLPLYNSVKWLEIGIPDSANISILPARMTPAVVTYGTSIMHGACASRPGMSWTAQLERMLNKPLINLGFSGNGLMETEILEFIASKDAAVYVLDCLPNLWRMVENDPDEAYKRLINGVKLLREKQQNIPILLVEHAGYTDGEVMPERKRLYQQANEMLQKAYQQLQGEGLDHLFYLSKEEINLSNDSMVDGTHPNDLGMYEYARAYYSALIDLFE